MKPVCLITGAGGLLGNFLCEALLGNFNILAIYKNRMPHVDSQLMQKINPNVPEPENRPAVYCVQADLTSRDDIRRIVEVALAKWGQIDHIINNAADVKFHGKLKELYQNGDYAANQLNINTIAPMVLSSAAYDACWKDRKKDNIFWNRSITNVSSMSGLYAHNPQGQGFYAASKAALNMLTLHLALELEPYAVRVNAVCPGAFKDKVAGSKVVNAIKAFMTGSASGEIQSRWAE